MINTIFIIINININAIIVMSVIEMINSVTQKSYWIYHLNHHHKKHPSQKHQKHQGKHHHGEDKKGRAEKAN